MSGHGPAYRAGLERFRRGIAGRSESKEIVRHLLSGCRECQQATSRIWPRAHRSVDEGYGSAPSTGGHSDGYDYSGVFARAETKLRHHQLVLAEERAVVPRLREELGRHPRSRQEVLVGNSSRYQTWSLTESLLDDCRHLCQADSEEATHLARLAIQIAEGLDAERYGLERVRDLQARSYAELANVLRVREQHREAEKCFGRARELLSDGTGDPIEEAGVLSLEASMWSVVNSFDRANALLDRTIATARRLGESELLAKALIQKAKYSADRGLPDKALSLLLEAQQNLDPGFDRRLAFTVQHNILYALVQAGRFEEAAAGLADTGALCRRLGYPIDQIRLAWLEGRVFHGLARVEEAEARFRFALDRMLAEGLDFDAAMVGLDLAVLYSEQNRSAETRELAAAMLPIFRSHQIQREAIAALLVFREAAVQERLSTELARELAAYFQRLLTEPNLRFRVPPGVAPGG